MPQAAATAQPGMPRSYPAPTMGYPRTPGVSPFEEWLRKPLRESNYLRGMGIGADDPFWDTYEDPRLENGGPPPESTGPSFFQAPAPLPDWPRGDGWPRPFPMPRPGERDRRAWDFDPEKHGDRPMEIVPFGADATPAQAGAPGPGDYGHGLPVPPPPESDDDPPPRIVAVVPHRNDREIADEIFATMQRNDAAREEEDRLSRSAALPTTMGEATVAGPHVQVAQALNPWTPFPVQIAPTKPNEEAGFVPIAQKNPFLPNQESLADHIQLPRGGGRGGGAAVAANRHQIQRALTQKRERTKASRPSS